MTLIRSDIKDGITKELKERLEQLANLFELNSGLYNGVLPEVHPRYNKADCEKVIEGSNNQFIIIGRDRPRGVWSGYGGLGNSHSACIDIIAGMTGMQARLVDEEGNLLNTDKSPELDAARIYVSQRTDIDKNFNLPHGIVGSPTPRSGIAIKADGVRIIARDGIKLVTGTDEYNSQGVRIDAISGIDLIAGGRDEDMQPLVKGNNLELGLREIIELIMDLSGIILNTQKNYFQLLKALQSHTHKTSWYWTGPSPGTATGTSSPPAFLARQCVNQYKKQSEVMRSIKDLQENGVKAAITFTYPFGDGYINSEYNYTN